jgi:hypothetical protein
MTPVSIPATPRINGLHLPRQRQRPDANRCDIRRHDPDPGPISDEGLATYVKSVDHFRNETKKAGVEVVVQNHPLMLPLQAWLDKFETRKKGDPNRSSSGKAGYQKFIDVLYACSEVNVARRKAT